MQKIQFSIIALFIILLSCRKEDTNDDDKQVQTAVESTFKGKIDLDNLPDYSAQTIPAYITKDNSGANVITDAGATLGRVLFYDKQLSVNNTISCGSCHKQAFAFGDGDLASIGVNGTTGRHSMRLINARFADEVKFFWDERAATLEEQTTMPIQDHTEMGYSGQNGDESINDLIQKLSALEYYNELFTFTFGDADITEDRMQKALAQFVRSIQSFDSPYDVARASAPNPNAPYPGLSQLENIGKQMFQAPPQFDASGVRIGGGFGCQGCHRAPEFDIAPNSRNNGVISDINGTGTDLLVERSPSLRDIFNPQGVLNGPLMHTASFNVIDEVINHYNDIDPSGNTNLDPRLNPGGNGQKLMISQTEKEALIAFLKTLSGSDVYVNERWSDPF